MIDVPCRIQFSQCFLKGFDVFPAPILVFLFVGNLNNNLEDVLERTILIKYRVCFDLSIFALLIGKVKPSFRDTGFFCIRNDLQETDRTWCRSPAAIPRNRVFLSFHLRVSRLRQP